MLTKLIGKLRRQPKKTRDNVALGVASTFTFIVASFWLFNIPNTFDGMLTMDSKPSEQSASFMERMGEQTAAVKEALTADEAASDSLKSLIDEYQGAEMDQNDSGAGGSGLSTASSSIEVASSSSASTSAAAPQEVRIQAVATATTSTTTNE